MSQLQNIDNAIRCVGLLLRAHEKMPELKIEVRDQHALCAIIPLAVAKKYAASKGHQFPEYSDVKTPPIMVCMMAGMEGRTFLDVAFDILAMAQDAELASAPGDAAKAGEETR